jgi:hypothetical protein
MKTPLWTIPLMLACLLSVVVTTNCRATEEGVVDLSEAKTPQATPAPDPAKKKIVFIAGRRSHGYGSHEHNAGCLFLAQCLDKNMPGLETVVYQNGWPSQADAFQGADAVVVFCDGAGGHIAIPHLEQLDALAKQGVGIGFIHFAVEVPKGAVGDHFLDWIGGYFELNWSVNPHWRAKFDKFPDHPVSRGVSPFEIDDEWYYHMRFREGLKGVTPVLSAVAPPSTVRGDGGRSGNPTVRAEVAAGKPQHLLWVTERADGGRGFGFTGGHWHWNWGHDGFRKAVLNAVVWVAGMDVPAKGVPSTTPTILELKANLDDAPPANFEDGRIEKLLTEWKGSSS